MIKLAIVGARLKNGLDKSFTFDKFQEHMAEYVQQMGFDMSNLTVVSGGAQGVDTYAEKWAKRHAVPIVVLKPDWKNKGKRAGLERNADIVRECTHMIAFPDVKNGSGTQHSVSLCQKVGKECRVINISI